MAGPDSSADSWAQWRPVVVIAVWTALCVVFSVLAYRALA